jgi:SlyX protein
MTASTSGNDARIDELEVRLAHQDQTVHELGNEVYRQQRQITQLEAVVRQLAARLAPDDAEPATDRPVDEVPPHY